MTEASGGISRAEMERKLIRKSLEEDFGQKLLDHPKAAMEQELGTPLPEGVQIQAVEETAETIYLVLPSTSAVGEVGEISDEALDAVAGGDGRMVDTFSGNTCDIICNYSTVLDC